MSITKMISEHPDVDGHVNDPLAQVAKHAMYAASITASCADACLAEGASEDAPRRQCIRTCLDASDAAQALAYIAARRTGSNEGVITAAMTFARAALTACHAECAKMQEAHCQRCATMCQELLDDMAKVKL